MKLCDFSEIKDAENGQQIPSFTGTIKKVFDQITGDGQYGTWYLQRLILQDAHADEITVTWCCEDAWKSSDEGKTLLFVSGHDKKDQLCGIKKEIRKKGDKVYESVKVDDRAKVTVSSEATESHNLPSAEEQHTESASKTPDGIQEAREHLMKACNLYNLCVDAVVSCICPHIPEEQRTNEQFQSTLASVWIEASGRRSTDGVNWWSYLDKMPASPLKK